MLKKSFKALTTLTLLVGCYFGYVHAFALVVEQLRAIKRTDNFVFAIHDSKSRQESIRYAVEACGADHWAADKELAYRYYNAERRYWIYAKECERIVEENGVRYDGKRLRLTPFLLISKSSDGKSTKTITSDVAVFDLNAPLSFNVNSSAEPLKIKHARLEPNVWVRDDKGTPRDPNDDMKIGPLTTVDYEESTQQIVTQLDTYVVVQDPELSATGYGMVMQLRKTDAAAPGGSTGFEGVERLDLLKNVHVVMRDVGKSGLMAGGAQDKKSAPGQAGAGAVRGTDPKTAEVAAPAEPTPLDLRCDSKMQVYLPKPQAPVVIGPPEPPAPTLVQFERNVVVLRGRPDLRPDQLTCDTLKLSLVPGEKPPPGQTPAPAPGRAQGPAQSADGVAQADAAARGDANTKVGGDAGATTGNSESSRALGGLTLQRVHATGHAVWLYLPAQGIKLVCNELIHVRQLPYKPDQTYFRGDKTRRLQLEKIDVVEEDGPDHGKVTSVTNIWAVDATLFDSGVGMDATNVVAHGPGRLETRPDRDKPVERIAIWQDRLIVQNELGTNNEVVHKIIDLVGNRPCFIDNLQKTSLDSGSWIQVWLKPKPAPPKATGAGSTAAVVASDRGIVNNEADPLMAANPPGTDPLRRDAEQKSGELKRSSAGMGGGGLQVEKLHARIDVHLLAPAKTMTARERLDAEFIEPEAAQVASSAPAKTSNAPANHTASAVAAPADAAAETVTAKAQNNEQVAAQDQAATPSEEPPTVGSCDRLWAKIAMKPKAESEKTSSTNEAAKGKTAPAGHGSGEMNADIRTVWMWGNVALHQDPKKVKDKKRDAQAQTKGQDASGEALYLDNRGPNQAITYVYQRDPSERTFLPGPLPPARVENNEIKIAAAGMIQMNQGTDQAWVHGPGTLTQLAARGFLTDKSKEPGDDRPADEPPGGDVASSLKSPDSVVKTRTTSFTAQNGVPNESAPARDKSAEPKPATRAGLPTSEKVPMTIGFSENMEFTGRSVDPEGKPAAQAEFYGTVTAQMEDALLHCTNKMIAYTDREVPLAQLGKMSQGQSQRKSDEDAAGADGEAKTEAELTLLYCYRNAVAISRKVDPDSPVLVQQQRIEAVDFLAYDRRTGDFYVPGKGKVYLYDKSDNSSQQPAVDPAGNGASATNTGLTATQRTVSTASSRTSKRSGPDARAQATGAKSATKRLGPQAKNEAKPSDSYPLTLIQVHFNKGMRGRFGAAADAGAGADTDQTDRRWSEFYGNVESARAKVPTAQTKFDFDRLPSDAMFLTGQTLLVTQDPPPVGSPKSAPSQYHMKAWEKVYTSSNDKILQSDVMTYDSYKDLIYAYGKDGHSVNYAEQHAAGQPISPGSASAVQLNPKTGGLNIINSNTIQLIDKNTGIRPSAAAPIDPYDRKKKPPKKPFKLPTMNIERRGFTGQ